MRRRWSPEKRRPSIFWLLAGIVRPIMAIFTRFEYRGHGLPATGSFILTPNHYTDIDPVLVGIATWDLGRLPRFLAKASLFRVPVVGMILRRSGQIPVERGSGGGNRTSVTAARQLVASDQGVIIYPEGTLTRQPDSWPMRGKHGAVRLSIASGAPIIPMAQWGGNALMQGHTARFRPRWRTPILVSVGAPIDLSAYRGREGSSTAMNEATAIVMAEITRLLAELRGETPPAEAWDPRAHGQSEFGKFTPGSTND